MVTSSWYIVIVTELIMIDQRRQNITTLINVVVKLVHVKSYSVMFKWSTKRHAATIML